ncbi:MAG TPA: hypothetical protein VIJ60_12995 [Acidimicrobiales bacterium]|jgi:hypothetical protein
MKWQILLEVRLHGEAGDIEALLDSTMEHLVDAGIEDPSVGAALEVGTVEIEFVVEADALEDAHQRARGIIADALALPPDSELVGESTRRAELVPA